MTENQSESTPDVVVSHADGEHRYEAHDGDKLAGFLSYVDLGEAHVLQHTIVGDEFGGRGVGSALAKFALDDARHHGLGVVPQCSFVAKYIEKHPEYADLVTE